MNVPESFLLLNSGSSIINDSTNHSSIITSNNVISEKLNENMNDISDEMFSKQIDRLIGVFNQNKEITVADINQNIRLLPLLVEQIQKNRSIDINIKLLNLFITMCLTSEKYIYKLCRIGILNTIKNFILSKNPQIKECTVTLLSMIVKLFVVPSKPYSKSRQFESEMRAALVEPTFLSMLFDLIIEPDQPDNVIQAGLKCLCQYTNDIYIPHHYIKSILTLFNYKLSQSSDDNLIIQICKTLNRHFVMQPNVIYLVSSCIIPFIASLLNHPNIEILSEALHVMGCIIALDRNDNENFDYTEYAVDCGIIKYLSELLKFNKTIILKEALWTVSNIIAGSTELIDDVIKTDCIQQAIELTKSPYAKEVKNEAYWIFMNGCTCGNDDQIAYFVKQGVIQLFVLLLREERQNQEVFDALECDKIAAVTHEVNPYAIQINSGIIYEITLGPPSPFQARALSFYNTYFYQCGICYHFYYKNDVKMEYCPECGFCVCCHCDCSIYHLDYQLATWNETEEKKVELKKKTKRKKKNVQAKLPDIQKDVVSAASLQHFKKLLKTYLNTLDILQLSSHIT